ncbi:hypothetical protein Bbelb_233030 [Branchiostoma belcheri]|nr:hypothetical protein Bbelb_233030 [Branchiostoma belcheri]
MGAIQVSLEVVADIDLAWLIRFRDHVRGRGAETGCSRDPEEEEGRCVGGDNNAEPLKGRYGPTALPLQEYRSIYRQAVPYGVFYSAPMLFGATGVRPEVYALARNNGFSHVCLQITKPVYLWGF